MLSFAQTLHGYDQGHRLLACGGDVDENELGQLDRLSDLSGYVPLGTSFDHYYTGFPCGRYYAFACTWPDIRATRAGTVLTHTLLLPVEYLDNLHDLWALTGHRRPESALDQKPYSVPLSLDPTRAHQAPPSPSPARAAEMIALWFGQEDRPVLWTENGGALDVVRYLWSLLWPEARKLFSFCTFALQVRYLRREPFGLLILPSSAIGSFHDRARSSAWWVDGQLLNPVLRERLEQPWVRSIVDQGLDATHAMERYCAEQGLPPLDALAYPVFFRFSELETPAKIRLTAARSRADLLGKLWPNLRAEHPLTQETLGFVLQHQSDAPLTPKPFWDLVDLAKRPAFFPLLDANAEFLRQVQVIYSAEIQRRVLEADEIRDVGLLIRTIKHPLLREIVVKTTATTIGKIPDEAAQVTKGQAALLSSIDAQASDLVSSVLQELPSNRRVTIAVQALEVVTDDQQQELADYVLTAAQKLNEIALVIDVWCTLGQPDRALADATKMVLAREDIRTESLNRILDRLDAEKRFTWALSIDNPRLMPWAGQRGAIAANELKLSISATIDRCSRQPNAGRVLLAYLDGIALASVKDEDLFQPPVSNALRAFATEPAMNRLADTLAPRLVKRMAQSTSTEDILPWLSLEALQKALGSISDWNLYSGYQSARSWDFDTLPNLVRHVATCIRTETPTSLKWVVNILGKPLHDAPTTSFHRAIDDLRVLVELPSQLEGWIPLATRILLAARKNRGRHAYLLIECVFPVLYPAIVSGTLDSNTRSQLSLWVWRDWDIAKNWRHWLLDVWITERWPADSFLRALGDDVALFRRIAHRAWHKEKAKDFVRGLYGSWGNDQRLEAQWRSPVNRFLANPDAGKDYE